MLAQPRRHRSDIGAKTIKSRRLYFVDPALCDDIGALPVIVAIQRHHHLAGAQPGKHAIGCALCLSDPKPQHIDRRADIFDPESGLLPQDRMTPIAGNGEIGKNP